MSAWTAFFLWAWGTLALSLYTFLVCDSSYRKGKRDGYKIRVDEEKSMRAGQEGAGT